MDSPEPPHTTSIVWLALCFEGGLVLLAWGLGWVLNHSPTDQTQLRWQAVALGVVATGPLLLVMWWCTRWPWKPIQRLLRDVDETLVPLFADRSYFTLAFISILAGLGEEALFRGVLQTTLADLINPWAALVATSTLFGLAHLITPTYALMAGLIGLYLGVLSMTSGNLLVVIVVHALYDFAALVYLVRRRT